MSLLENLIFPHIGNTAFTTIKPKDFLLPAQQAELRGHIATAHCVLQLCGQVSRYARITGIVEVDAASGLSEALTPAVIKHHAAITDPAEVSALLRNIDAYSGGLITRYALKIMSYVITVRLT